MKLHDNIDFFKDAIRVTAKRLNILDIYVEKDYWVTYALKLIFNSELSEETVFKGGTSLSKCYGLIDRFSEDIDLVVLRKKNETPNQLKKKIRHISKILGLYLPEVDIDDITQKKGMNRKTAHVYKKAFDSPFGQIRDKIIVEASWLGNANPHTQRIVSSYVHDMMNFKKQFQLIGQYELQPFKLNVLEPKRTLCEKIMSLIRFSYNDNPIMQLKKKIRHVYDLCLMLQNPELMAFFNSDSFEELLLDVAQKDVESYKSNNKWLSKHPNESLLFSNLADTWNLLKRTYSIELRNLVFTNGRFPNEEKILKTLQKIKGRLETVSWSTKVNS
ncbi:MAG: nucleotidyl transferase AbiEii/AbiGii toxin family protein [Flavobacteriaceae bacterium]|nr:nucleotidyl transferase AbiEii/AbiGii toxin family protein [Flavobacteriaceae bacterium]